MQRRNKVAVTAVALIAALALTSCGSSAPQEGPDSGEIVFRTFDPPAEAAGLQGALDLWNKTHDVKAKLETVAVADALAKYTREVNTGGGPDVSQQAFTWVRDLAKADLVMNLDDDIAKSAPGAGIDDFIGLDMGQSGGSTYGIPWSVDTFALAYDPAALKDAGVTELPDTWEGFAKTAAKLTTADRAGFCFGASSAPVSEVWHLLNYYLWSHGATLVKKDGSAWKVGASESQLTDAFAYFNGFFTSGTTPKALISVDNAGDPSINNALATGTCAVAFMSPAQFRVAAAANPDLRTASVPVGEKGTPTTHLGGRSLVINPNTKHPEAAWELLKFLASKDVFSDYYPNQFPAQKALLDAIDYGPAMKGYVDELPTARSYLQYVESPAPTSEYWNNAVQAMGSVFSGQNSPSQAAADFAKKLNELLSK